MFKSLFVITLLSMGLIATVSEIRTKVEYGHFLWIAKKAIFSLEQKTDVAGDYTAMESAGSVSKWYMWANYFGKLSKTGTEAPVYDVTYSVTVDGKNAQPHSAPLVSSEAGKPLIYEGYSVIGLCPADEIKEVRLDNVKFDGTKTFVVTMDVKCKTAKVEEATAPNTAEPKGDAHADEKRVIL